ncbi:MAG: PAS domain S-box protein, partial [Rhodobacteraceae bacterium]|nr:PAS domain S-box protein [Paracoccaceae bacterium]
KLPRTYHELERANAALSEQIVARQRSEAEYLQTFRLAPQGVAHVVPGSGAFIRANERFCAISGYSAGELAHMHLTDLAAPEDLPVWRSVALKDASVAVHRQIRCRRKDGEVIWVSINAILIHGQGQEPLYTVVTMDDITYKKRAEGQIRQLSRELSHLSRGNTMGQMAAGLAHELNQPLTAIAQNADTALHLLGQKPTDVAELNEILSEISQQSLRSGEIIRALRGFIMRDEGARIAFDFGMLLTQTMLLVQAEATEAGVTIETTVPADMPMLEGNRVQVAQVLVNLLRNAIEAMSTGVDTDRLVTVRATAHGRQAMIEVEDNGPGISPDIALFTQFDTSKPNGMGLGLSICRSIVEANGGTLIHDDSYVGGARFCFTLPVAREARDVTEHPETKEHLAEGADAT